MAASKAARVLLAQCASQMKILGRALCGDVEGGLAKSLSVSMHLGLFQTALNEIMKSKSCKPVEQP